MIVLDICSQAERAKRRRKVEGDGESQRTVTVIVLDIAPVFVTTPVRMLGMLSGVWSW